MDNRITKERLTSFLRYEWLKIVALVLCVCFAFFLLFNQLGSKGRKLTDGQQYYLLYSPDMHGICVENVDAFIESDKPFSYDVQDVSVAQFDETYGKDQLSAWTAIGNADMLFCSDLPDDLTVDESEFTYQNSYLRNIVDTYSIYDLDKFYLDACEYAKQFKIKESGPFKENNVSREKTDAEFDRRMKKDKRFKKDDEIAVGKQLEYERIVKLFKDITDFEKLLTMDIFVEYQSESRGDTTAKKYAIDLYKLKDYQETGVRELTSFAVIKGESDTRYSTLAVFDYKNRQPELQYESLAFINAMIRATTIGVID